MRLPVQTAVCDPRGEGALTWLVAVQVSVAGSYRAPLLSGADPHAIIRSPVQTRVAPGAGASFVDIADQVSITVSYRPPLLPSVPPQTSMRLPVQRALWPNRGLGRSSREPLSHVSSGQGEIAEVADSSGRGIGSGPSGATVGAVAV